jgi:hypothetical protein
MIFDNGNRSIEHINCTVRAMTMRGLLPPNTFSNFSFEEAFDHWAEKCRRRKVLA